MLVNGGWGEGGDRKRTLTRNRLIKALFKFYILNPEQRLTLTNY